MFDGCAITHTPGQKQEKKLKAGIATGLHLLVNNSQLERVAEISEFFLGLFLGAAIALLDPAGEFFALTFDYLQVIVSQFAPLGLYFAFELFPVSL